MRDIYFYIPKEHWPEKLPSPDEAWAGYKIGIYCWTLQTYNKLVGHSDRIKLVDTFPEEGIIIAHRGLLPDDIRPSKKQYLVCIQADWSRHPFAKMHISQNLAQTKSEGVPKLDRMAMPGKTVFTHLWPQPGLLPRNPNRPSELNKLSYYGLEYNLAEELKSEDWKEFLKAYDIEWDVVDDDTKWCDYRETDGVLFVRDFQGKKHINKPATKLYNTWITNAVPFCAEESAYMDEIEQPNDAVVIKSYEDLKQKIIELKSNPDKFAALLRRSKALEHKVSDDSIRQEWNEVFAQIDKEIESDNSYIRFYYTRLACYWITRLIGKIRG